MFHLLTHGDDHAGGGSGIGAVQEADAPRPARRVPSRCHLKASKHPICVSSPLGGDSESAADNRDDAEERADDREGVQHGKPPVAPSRDRVAEEGNGEEDQVRLPRAGLEGAGSFRVLEDVDAAD